MDFDALAQCLSSAPCLVTQSTSGLVIGLLMFLTASGLTLVFGVLGIANFAHGAFYMLGAYMAYTVYANTGSYLLAVAAAALFAAACGAVFERFVVRPLKGTDVMMQLVACFALVLIIDDAAKLIWGPAAVSLGVPASMRLPPVHFQGGVVPVFYLVLMALSAAFGLAIWWLITRTRFGMTMRAVAELPSMASALGKNVNRYASAVLALGCGLAGVAGALAAPMRAILPGTGLSILLESFVVVVIGGMGSIPGALVAALLLGFTRSFGSIGFPLFTEGLMFLFMVAVLVLRPQGLFSRVGRTH
ncbi:branched-chain amino acid ABC transporter permease [Variovorax sp. EBFNA2]|uniref:branched-chain amino acid ABC transporter permease n=1 Tax=Variovorax sp. EBFNA2 TaxID=3342097 RepID=UPI0029BFB9AD|nr:branched-chain amino acid ABC transporter permease [Variovorax boronicumulans]WPG41051.1 branched-chain amino acid ABC transporter permease [Variovorax boronicumulans]